MVALTNFEYFVRIYLQLQYKKISKNILLTTLKLFEDVKQISPMKNLNIELY